MTTESGDYLAMLIGIVKTPPGPERGVATADSSPFVETPPSMNLLCTAINLLLYVCAAGLHSKRWVISIARS
jgi:hypothetical protein